MPVEQTVRHAVREDSFVPDETASGTSAVFDRLHALVRKGYVADVGTSTGTEIVVLRHAGKAPDLVLHGDGLVEGLDGRRPATSAQSMRLRPSPRTGTPSISGS